MPRTLRIFPSYFSNKNQDFDHPAFLVNTSDRTVNVGYDGSRWDVLPTQIIETDDPVAGIIMLQGEEYDFDVTRGATGISVSGSKTNIRNAFKVFLSESEALYCVEQINNLKAPQEEAKKHTAESLKHLSGAKLRQLIEKLNVEQPPEEASNEELRGYILSAQG